MSSISKKEPYGIKVIKEKSRTWREEVLNAMEYPSKEEFKEFIRIFLIFFEKNSKLVAKIKTYKKFHITVEEIGNALGEDLDYLERSFKKNFGYNLEADRVTLMQIKEKRLPEVLEKYKIKDSETARSIRKGVKRKKQEVKHKDE